MPFFGKELFWKARKKHLESKEVVRRVICLPYQRDVISALFGVFKVFTGVFLGEEGHVCVVGLFWRHLVSILEILGSFGVPKWS